MLTMLTPERHQVGYTLPVSSDIFRVGSVVFILKFTLNWGKCLLRKKFLSRSFRMKLLTKLVKE